MLQYVYQKFKFQEKLKISSFKYQQFALKLQSSYRENPYHTSIHAADVVQNVYYYLQIGAADIIQPSILEYASLFISSAAHDVDHPGNNNVFETKTRSKLATLYNDQAVLENHHTATFFFLIEDEQLNIFENFSGEDLAKIRKMIIENILYTDMSKHFVFMNEIQAMPEKEDFAPASKHKQDIMKALVHAADIGNPARPFELCKTWALKILSEFFQQGDRERGMGLEVTILCDRKNTNIGKSQIGFIDFVVNPYFEKLTRIIPQMSYTCDQMKHNKNLWSQQIELYEKQREENGNEGV